MRALLLAGLLLACGSAERSRRDAEQARRDADWAAHPELTAQLACVAWCERITDPANQWHCGEDCRRPPLRFYPDAGR